MCEPCLEISAAELPFLACVELAALVRTRRIKARQLLEVFISRVEAYNPSLNAIVVFDFEKARRIADEADAVLDSGGKPWGPLHGVPCTIKESMDVAGLPLSLGVKAWKDRISSDDEVAVKRLREAGAVIFGKTNIPLGAMDVQSYNTLYGSSSNPWDLTCTPGGSSGGASAAVAAGLCAFELGSDVGGSIRTPAAFCGIYGHRATYGIIPQRGPTQVGFPMECLVRGPLARSPEDLRLLLEVTAGPDDYIASRGWQLKLPTPTKKSLKEYTFAVWADADWALVDERLVAAAASVATALESVGAKVDRTARPPGFDAGKNLDMYIHLTAANAVVKDLPLPKDASLQRYRQAQEDREAMRRQWEAFFEQYDMLICPAYPSLAFPKIEKEKDFRRRTLRIKRDRGEVDISYLSALLWAYLTTTAHLPTTTFPCGVCKESGLPLGLNIVSREYNDLLCIDVARLLRDECGYSFTPPPAVVASPSRSKL